MQKDSFETSSAGVPPSRLAYTRSHGWHLVFKRTDLETGSDPVPAIKKHRGVAGSSAVGVLSDFLGSACPCLPYTVGPRSTPVWQFPNFSINSREAIDAGKGKALPKQCWRLHTNKKSVLCMTNELSEWNASIKRTADDCSVLASQILAGLQENVEQCHGNLVQVLDSISLLDFLSGYVAYMHSQQDITTYCRPVLSPHAGASLLQARACLLPMDCRSLVAECRGPAHSTWLPSYAWQQGSAHKTEDFYAFKWD